MTLHRARLRLIVLGSVCLPILAAQAPLPNPAAIPRDRSTEVDAAVVRALEFLARAQNADGSWSSQQLGSSTALTSLSIMAFLAAGHVPDEGPYATHLANGIRWILSQQQPSGMFLDRGTHGPMYSHGITTLMLAEVLGMTPAFEAERIRDALSRAVNLILLAQSVRKSRKHAGGWRYHRESTDSDLSVTGWQLLALRAAQNVGCDIPVEQIDAAVEYVKRCSTPGHNGFGYQPGDGPTPVRSGTGILCLEICGEHLAAESVGAGDYLLQHPLSPHQNFYYYGVYYCGIGTFQLGGRYWEATRERIVSDLLSRQSPSGAWTPHPTESMGGVIYSTSLAVLSLSVDYQYLPIYQR
jgi:hypothetical protein